MVVKDSGRVRDSRETSSENALSPMRVTPSAWFGPCMYSFKIPLPGWLVLNMVLHLVAVLRGSQAGVLAHQTELRAVGRAIQAVLPLCMLNQLVQRHTAHMTNGLAIIVINDFTIGRKWMPHTAEALVFPTSLAQPAISDFDSALFTHLCHL